MRDANWVESLGYLHFLVCMIAHLNFHLLSAVSPNYTVFFPLTPTATLLLQSRPIYCTIMAPAFLMQHDVYLQYLSQVTNGTLNLPDFERVRYHTKSLPRYVENRQVF